MTCSIRTARECIVVGASRRSLEHEKTEPLEAFLIKHCNSLIFITARQLIFFL